MALYRKILLERRNRIENKPERDEKIREAFFSFLPETVKRVFIYASYGSEVDTNVIIDTLLERNIEVYCPKVYDHGMEFFRIMSREELAPGYSDLPEPVIEITATDEKTIDEIAHEIASYPTEDPEDICIIPGLAFDVKGARMGYGKAYYDRYLTEHHCLKVALSYEDQVEPSLIVKEHDVMMDKLITEKKMREWNW